MKRQGPEVKIITLFTALPDESKRIVYDLLRSQMATPRQKTKKPEKVKLSVKDALKVTDKASTGKAVLPEDPNEFKFAAGV